MAITPRISLVSVDSVILSSYPLGKPRSELKLLNALPMGRVPPDVALALLALHRALTALGVDFRVTEAKREVAEQAAARQKYDNYLRWVAKGKPGAFDPKTMKADFVAAPGLSMHNAGRAIDINLEVLRFPNVVASKQLDTLWDLARPLGWTPIIKEATEGKSESWHFDFYGEWASYHQRYADYSNTAMCASLDIGVSGYGNDEAKALQAQLQRAGFDCGKVDGAIGGKTTGALKAAGFSTTERDYTKLYRLPSSAAVRWKP